VAPVAQDCPPATTAVAGLQLLQVASHHDRGGPTPDSPTPSAGCSLGWGCCCPFLPPPPTLPPLRPSFQLLPVFLLCRLVGSLNPRARPIFIWCFFGVPFRIILTSSLFCLVSTLSLSQISLPPCRGNRPGRRRPPKSRLRHGRMSTSYLATASTGKSSRPTFADTWATTPSSGLAHTSHQTAVSHRAISLLHIET
jgi:hypothetical protein